MRAITQKIGAAFLARTRKADGATATDGTTLTLHGNAIAQWREDGLWFTLAGWDTLTTRERLKGVGVVVNRVKGLPCWRGRVIDEKRWYRMDDGMEAAA